MHRNSRGPGPPHRPHFADNPSDHHHPAHSRVCNSRVGYSPPTTPTTTCSLGTAPWRVRRPPATAEVGKGAASAVVAIDARRGGCGGGAAGALPAVSAAAPAGGLAAPACGGRPPLAGLCGGCAFPGQAARSVSGTCLGGLHGARAPIMTWLRRAPLFFCVRFLFACCLHCQAIRVAAASGPRGCWLLQWLPARLAAGHCTLPVWLRWASTFSRHSPCPPLCRPPPEVVVPPSVGGHVSLGVTPFHAPRYAHVHHAGVGGPRRALPLQAAHQLGVDGAAAPVQATGDSLPMARSTFPSLPRVLPRPLLKLLELNAFRGRTGDLATMLLVEAAFPLALSPAAPSNLIGLFNSRALHLPWVLLVLSWAVPP